MPVLQQLASYQDRILQKAGEFSSKLATFAAQGLAAETKGTAKFFLLLYVMLYAIYKFLTDGRHCRIGSSPIRRLLRRTNDA